MRQQRRETLSRSSHSSASGRLLFAEISLAAGRQLDSGVKAAAGREPGWVAGGTGHLRNDEKLYEHSDDMKKRVRGQKVFEMKRAEFRMGDWIQVGVGEEEGSNRKKSRSAEGGTG